MENDKKQRFTLMVEAFGDADSSGVDLITGLVVFFNTILSRAFMFEERVILREEMIQAGILEAIRRIRDFYGLSEVMFVYVCVCFDKLAHKRAIRACRANQSNTCEY